MKLFRINWLQNAATLVTGIIFLNMSFFLAEVKYLNLDKDRQMIENIAKLIAGAANEEEKDACGGTSEDLKTDKEIHLLLNGRAMSDHLFLLPFQNVHPTSDGAKPVSGHQETINPPPEA